MTLGSLQRPIGVRRGIWRPCATLEGCLEVSGDGHVLHHDCDHDTSYVQVDSKLPT